MAIRTHPPPGDDDVSYVFDAEWGGPTARISEGLIAVAGNR